MNLSQFFTSTAFTLLFLSSASVAYADRNAKFAMDDSGNTVVVWFDPKENVIKSCINYNKCKGTVSVLSSANDPKLPAIASAKISGDLSAVVIWSETNFKLAKTILYARTFLPHTHTWTNKVQISTNVEDVQDNYQVKINQKGNICATWSACLPNEGECIRYSTSEADSLTTWSTPETLSDPDYSNESSDY